MAKHANVLNRSHGSQRDIKEANIYGEERKDTIVGSIFVD
jgi:hypothetical protein